MLNNDETIKLIQQAQKGNEEAKNLLVENNFPLVKSIIKRFKNKNIEYDDLYQIGFVGFIKAINNFNTEFNVKFSTYVVPMVIGEVKRFLRDDGYIKVSRNIKMQNILISKYVEKYKNRFGKSPSLAEISNEFSIDQQEIMFIMDSSQMPISIFTPFDNNENGLLLIDRYNAKDNTSVVIDKLALKDALLSLPQKERKILLMRYFFDKTQSEIAKELNISQVQVSRIENKVLELLKEKLSG